MKRTLQLLLLGCLLRQLTALAQSSPHPADADPKGPIKLEVVPFPPYHAAGNDVPTVLRLKRENGQPVTLEDLQVSDAANVDLLVIDEGLSDFHYQHLTATDTPGEYRFVLRSKYGGRYFVWAGVSSRTTGEKQFEKATVRVEGEPKPLEEIITWIATTDGYHYHLSLAGDKELVVGKPARLNLEITTIDGESVELEPMTARFGCLAAFAGDLTSAALIFPADDLASGESAQGGSQLTFTFTPRSAGFWKLFTEIKAGGFARVVSFGVNVNKPTGF